MKKLLPKTTHKAARLLLMFFVLLSGTQLAGAHAQTRYYVTPGGAGTLSGSSWANAMDSTAFRNNIATISYGDTIWVAAGTYHPDLSNANSTFTIPSGVAVYGGFNGTETALSQRNIRTNITALDGAGVINNIVYFNHVDSTTTLDGFTISNGNNPATGNGGVGSNYSGAAIYNDGSNSGNSNPVIANDSFVNNGATSDGGAIFNLGLYGIANPVIYNCMFNNNTTVSSGGAIYNDGELGESIVTITNSVFTTNTSSNGGAIFNFGFSGESNATVTNCLFTNNRGANGSTIVDYGYVGICNSVYTNCTFATNGASNIIVYESSSAITFTNCILWDSSTNEIYNGGGVNITVNNSDIYGGYAGSNNINANPLFVSSTNFNLQQGSPAINTGSNAAVPPGITTDLAVNVRIQQGTVDMGAYESPYATPITHYYVTPAGAGTLSGSSWANAMDSTTFRNSISTIAYGDTIWVAAGTYHPDLSNANNYFNIPSGVKVYGGFNGTETTLSQRNIRANITVLDGADFINNIVYFYHVDSTTTLDGFTISNGNNPTNGNGGIGGNNSGAGIYNDGSYGGSSNPVIANDSFANNSANVNGGAIFNYGNSGTANAVIHNCMFTNNTSYSGGAIFNYGSLGISNATITNCIFNNNAALYGGVIYNSGGGGESNTTVTNCLFSNNPGYVGATIFDYGVSGICNSVYTNCTFFHNISTIPIGIVEYNSTSTFVNCILWDTIEEIYNYNNSASITVNNSDVYGGWTGTGSNNINGNPLFINSGAGNLHLLTCSPAFNAGTSTGAPSTDILGNARPALGGYDMGAYEMQTLSPTDTAKFITGTIKANGGNDTLKVAFTGNGPWTFTYTDGTNTYGPDTATTSPYSLIVAPHSNTVYTLASVTETNMCAKVGTPSTDTVNVKISSRIYVTPAGAGTLSGSSWANAMDSITFRNSLSGTAYGDTFWVAAGIYHPDLSNSSNVFNIPTGVAVYGGFNGTETTLSQRNTATNVTVLSGGQVSRSVIVFDHVDSTTVLDGFTITGGNGGIGQGAYGGGIYVNGENSASNPQVNNCIITNNTAGYGGGIFMDGSTGGNVNMSVTNCMITNNSGSNNGGGIYVWAAAGTCTTSITNCVFSGNSTNSYGGGIINDGSVGTCTSVITNCTFTANTAYYGAATANFGGGVCNVTITNTIDWGNTNYGGGGDIFDNNTSSTVSYSDVAGGWTGTGSNNINSNPLFVNTTSNNYQITSCSPAFNTGAVVTATTDLLGNPRTNIIGGYDMGAYSVQTLTPHALKVYVNVNATGAGTGANWTDAYTTLQVALTGCVADTIWVAAGTYQPDLSNALSTFTIPSGVAVYGGFAGTETTLSQRNIRANITALDGGSVINNIVNFNHVDSTTTLDGFTISNGNSPTSSNGGVGGHYAGAAIYNDGSNNGRSNPVIANDSFVNNFADYDAGAIFNYAANHGTTNPVIIHCSFVGNSTNGDDWGGGAIDNYAEQNGTSSPVITDCIFNGNISVYNDAGAIMNDGYIGNSNPVITNCLFINNTAYEGAALFNFVHNGTCSPVITNSTFALNTAYYGGTIWDDGASSNVTNCILWDNAQNEIASGGKGNSGSTATVNYSDIYGGWSGTGANNIKAKPLFVSSTNFNLQALSPCINGGSNAGIPVSIVTDLAGNARIQHDTIDMGAYESPYTAPIPVTRFYVTTSGAGNLSGTSWANAMDVNAFGNNLPATAYGDTFWVAAGTYSGYQYVIPSGVKIYGGFNGTETAFNQRNVHANITDLDGGGSFTVVSFTNVDGTTTIDGFTISNGSSKAGGGIYNDGGNGGSSNPVIANDSFVNNDAYYGGAMYNYGGNGNCSPVITNCAFINNTASNAAGIYNDGNSGIADAKITDCIFISNTSNGNGGAILNWEDGGIANDTVTNTLFIGNSAQYGGAVYNDGEYSSNTSSFTNCTFVNNTSSGIAGAMINQAYSGSANVTILNCIMQDGGAEIADIYGAASTVMNSDIQGGWSGNGSNNISANPRFINATTGNYQITSCSPAFNTGTVVTATTDLLGNPRTNILSGYDMGAYSVQTLTTPLAVAYVNVNATGAGTGTSWTDAFTTLQAALAMPCAPQQVWVAAGTYYPSVANPGNTYNIPSGVKVYGGFAGTETLLSQRNATTNVTTLDGINVSSSVVVFDHVDSTTYIDGFTIQRGNGGIGGSPYGSGYGGGIYINGSNTGQCMPHVNNCSIINNTASYGGGIFIDGNTNGNAGVILSNSNISYNTGSGNGGGIYVWGDNGTSSAVVTNCTFIGNSTNGYGGGLFNDGSSGTCTSVVTNCSFQGNSAQYGGGVLNLGGVSCTATITNCIAWNNTNTYGGTDIYDINTNSTVSYSDQAGGWGGNGTNDINADPLFIDASNGNLQITSCSPAFNTGTVVTFTTDILGNPRTNILGGYDMGAYSVQSLIPADTAKFITGTIVSNGGNQTLQVSFTGAGPWIFTYTDGTNTYGPDTAHTSPYSIVVAPTYNTVYTLSSLTVTGACNVIGSPATDTVRNPLPTHCYVTMAGAGTMRGNSWANAMDSVTFRNSLPHADYADTFWIAAGIYHPDLSNTNNNYTILSGVKVYGGFNGTETLLSQRNIYTNRTVLDGANSISNVVYFNHVDSTTILDGFTIAHGAGISGAYNASCGGGIFNDGSNGGSSNPQIVNDSFVNNTAGNLGGAIFNYAEYGMGNPTISHCAFINNYSSNEAGVMYNDAENGGTCNIVITDCIFKNNSAAFAVGVLFNDAQGGTANSVITNCLFINNAGGDYVAAIYNNLCIATITNCTFAGNTAPGGYGVVYSYAYAANIANCIMWDGNTNEVYDNNTRSTVHNTDIYGGWGGAGTNNISTNPLFISSTNFQLQKGSPCINTGSNAAVPTGVTKDLAGNIRIAQGTVDMGAYESDYIPCPIAVATPAPATTQVCYNSAVAYTDTTVIGNATYQWQYTTSAPNTVNAQWVNFGTNITAATLTGITQLTYTRVVLTVPGCPTVSSPSAVANVSASLITVTASNVTTNSAVLNWNAITGASYTIVVNGNTYTSNTNTYTLTGLSACTAYNVNVTANNSACIGTPQGSTNFNTSPAALTLTLTAGTSGSLVANWSAGTGPYKLYYGQQAGPQNLTVVNVKAGITTYTIPAKSLAAGTAFIAYIADAGSACSPLPQSPYAYYSTPGGSCTGTAPVIVSATSTVNSITFNWTGTAATYQVYYKSPGGNWSSYTKTSTTCTITGLTPGTCYPFFVVNKCGKTFGWSSAIDTICTSTLCAAPLNLELSEATCKGFTATWNGVTGASSYQVYCASSSGGGTPWLVSYAKTATSSTFAIFAKGATITVYVQSNCTNGGRSTSSNIQTITTLNTGCKDDNGNTALTGTSINTNSFSVYPNPNTGTFKVLMNTLATNTTATLDVMDVLGRLVYSTDVTNNNGVINESIYLGNTASSGIYMVRVRCGNDTHIAKVEVQR